MDVCVWEVSACPFIFVLLFFRHNSPTLLNQALLLLWLVGFRIPAVLIMETTGGVYK
jgi:hypothetical protein